MYTRLKRRQGKWLERRKRMGFVNDTVLYNRYSAGNAGVKVALDLLRAAERSAACTTGSRRRKRATSKCSRRLNNCLGVQHIM